jgi:putative molybdopterin biosynthesis protein
MKTASDIKKDQKILTKGTSLSSRQIGMLAAIGKAKTEVYRTPKVAVLSTGPEITEPGKRLTPAKTYDINAYSLSAAVTESGADHIYLGVIQDDLSELQKALKNALASADVVVTSGGVSVGPKDIMPRAVNSLGKPGLIVCGISIKPGKPTTIASIYGKPVFSLPGHPASALLVFDLLARPLIQQMARKEVVKPAELKAVAGTRMFPAKGRRTYVMVKLARDKKDIMTATPLASSLSGAITTLAKADGYVQILENVQFIEAGEQCTVHIFNGQNPRN